MAERPREASSAVRHMRWSRRPWHRRVQRLAAVEHLVWLRLLVRQTEELLLLKPQAAMSPESNRNRWMARVSQWMISKTTSKMSRKRRMMKLLAGQHRHRLHQTKLLLLSRHTTGSCRHLRRPHHSLIALRCRLQGRLWTKSLRECRKMATSKLHPLRCCREK